MLNLHIHNNDVVFTFHAMKYKLYVYFDWRLALGFLASLLALSYVPFQLELTFTAYADGIFFMMNFVWFFFRWKCARTRVAAFESFVCGFADFNVYIYFGWFVISRSIQCLSENQPQLSQLGIRFGWI